MSEELTEELREDAPESADSPQPAGSYPLTARMVAIAKGEDPDAVTAEPESSVDEAEADATPEPEKVEQPTTWIQDADRQRAAAYGLDPEDLDSFTSREDYGRYLRLLDKAVTRREPTPQPVAQTKDEPTAEPEYVDQPFVNGKPNAAYWEKHADEFEGSDYLKQFAEYTSNLEKKLSDFEAQQQEQFTAQQREQAERYLTEFHRAVDAFRPDFFGSSVDKSGQPHLLKGDDLNRRAKLLDACNSYCEHLHREQERQGLSPYTPPLSDILKHAEFIAFPEEATTRAREEAVKEREAQLKKVAAQAKRVRPVASTASAEAAYRGAPESDPHSPAAILKHPELEAWRRRHGKS